jgi:hypothetical protein
MWGLPRPVGSRHSLDYRDMRYSPKYKVTRTPSYDTSRLTHALPVANREKNLKISSDKVPTLVH